MPLCFDELHGSYSGQKTTFAEHRELGIFNKVRFIYYLYITNRKKMIKIDEVVNNRPVWKHAEGNFYIFSWVFEDGERNWRLGSNFERANAWMISKETSLCPYNADGSRFAKNRFCS